MDPFPVIGPRLRRRIAALCVVAALAAVMTGCGSDSPSARVEVLPAGVLVRVDGSDITAAQLGERLRQERAAARASGETVPAPGAAEWADYRRDIVADLVAERITGLEADRCGVPCGVSEADLIAELDRLANTPVARLPERLRAALGAQRSAFVSADWVIRYDLLRRTLLEHVTADVTFSSADARAFYDAHPEMFQAVAGGRTTFSAVEAEIMQEQLAAARRRAASAYEEQITRDYASRTVYAGEDLVPN